MDKRSLTEADIRSKYILPAILGQRERKWDLQSQILEEYPISPGRIIVQGKRVRRGQPRRADYLLSLKPNLPLAIVEAKDNTHALGDGMQQALDYAETMDVPFAYSSNGDGFLEHDRTGSGEVVTRELALEEFPGPNELWRRYCTANDIEPEIESVVTQDYYDYVSGKKPRYYQMTAINRTVKAIAEGQDRVLLVMATGTGKTYTAFQIIWRLWKAGVKKRILFLADRNILVDQTKTNDFKPFGSAMTKVTKRTIDKSYEVYLSLYQAVTGAEEIQQVYKEFSPDFFDLIVVDECHRGSAADDAAWREILEYFSSATQVGLTATPKETKEVSNIEYFGDPIFTYSLREGIGDGFLAPFKVVRVGLDKDLDGWRPQYGQRDKHGRVIEDREYNERDYDKTLILEQRTKLVAEKVTDFLKATDRYHKTIIFCEDIDHAERMRQAMVNANADLAADNRRYVMRITGDNDEGKAQLENFIDPASRYPVIATTSRLMATGVDAQTCRLIVLDRTINSMAEFKQIIGRGTRINEDYDKYYFTIMDFRKATAKFADPDFDGPPVSIYNPLQGVPPVSPDEEGDVDPDDSFRPPKYVVDDVPVEVVMERVQYLDADGRLITESLRDYSRKRVREEFDSLDEFLQRWRECDRKQAMIEELSRVGVFFDDLADMVGRDYDAFDLICHIAFDAPPVTRAERAKQVKKRDIFGQFGETARTVLDALLEKYADGGLASLESMDILKVDPIRSIGTPIEIVNAFGGKSQYVQAVKMLEDELYAGAA